MESLTGYCPTVADKKVIFWGELKVHWRSIFATPLNATIGICSSASWFFLSLFLLFIFCIQKKKKIYIYMHTKLLESSLTLCNLMDCSLHGSSVHEVLQARILECIAMLSSKGSSQPRNRTHISYASCIGRQVLYHWHHLGSPYIIISSIEFTH